VGLEPAEDDADESRYNGPTYEDLDDNLKEDFENYLAERGIDATLGEYLLALSNDKEQREYMRWLQEVKAFVS
jgi:complement component 1 Q subcomponent-binding protein, mitochondrial